MGKEDQNVTIEAQLAVNILNLIGSGVFPNVSFNQIQEVHAQLLGALRASTTPQIAPEPEPETPEEAEPEEE